MELRIATWNVNSVRLRLDGLAQLVADRNPDIVCLQETKVADGQFPTNDIRALGFEHIEILGQKSYNGVAILSRIPLQSPGHLDWCDRQDCRHVFARIATGVELHNFYVPAGGDLPDREANEKFAHKLDFLQAVTEWMARRKAENPAAILVGDLNIAPHENDVWSHKQLLKVVSHTPVEVDALDRMYQSLDWIDAVRSYIPTSEKLYSWWSYRSPNWEMSDRGRRLDHIWVTPQLRNHLRGVEVLKAARSWEKPSDHVPVIATIDLPT